MARETQTLTVMFADITESSRLYQQLGDGIARGVIDECLRVLSAILPHFKGRLVKTLGDAIMCVFPDASSAVSAAVEMQSAVSAGQAGDHPLRIHVGLHAGPVLVENDDIFGDTVNAAAFLTNVAMADQILISESTGLELVAPIKINLMAPAGVAADKGSLIVSLNDERLRVDRWRPLVTIGRAAECDLVVNDHFASRRHCSIRFVRTSFYLVDHSVNGTYVTLASGDEIHLLRGETVIEGGGEIRLGRSRADQVDDVITFQRDRRSQYRV
jgi:adenylate cyclase